MNGKKETKAQRTNHNGSKAEAYGKVMMLYSFIRNPIAKGINFTQPLKARTQGIVVLIFWIIFFGQMLLVIDSAISGLATYNIYGAITTSFVFTSKFISMSVEIIFTLFLFYVCYVNTVSWLIKRMKEKYQIK